MFIDGYRPWSITVTLVHGFPQTPHSDLFVLSSIVAVHGLNGDSIKTWTSESEGVCWLSHPDFLPKYVNCARVLTWGYNANISSLTGKTTSSNRILQHAQTLVAQLDADREVSTFGLQTKHTRRKLEYFSKKHQRKPLADS